MAKKKADPEKKEEKINGRPPIFKTPQEMQKKIDAYFEKCKGKPLTRLNNDTGEEEPITYKGIPIMVDTEPPTITGLALAIGLNSRQALLNYQNRDESFNDTVRRAKARVEAYTEGRLFDKDGARGAEFSLRNNFKNWADKKEIDVGNSGEAFEVNINIID